MTYNHLDLAGITNTKCGIKKAGTKIVGGAQTEVSFLVAKLLYNSKCLSVCLRQSGGNVIISTPSHQYRA